MNPDGEVKKAHWHIILFFDGKRSFEQVQEITAALNATIPQKTANAKRLGAVSDTYGQPREVPVQAR